MSILEKLLDKINEDDRITKICTKCKRELPATDENFPQRHDRRIFGKI